MEVFFSKWAVSFIIALPEFRDNESVINDFLHRGLLWIYNARTRTDIVDAFSSPKQRNINEELNQPQSEEKILKNRFADVTIRFGERPT